MFRNLERLDWDEIEVLWYPHTAKQAIQATLSAGLDCPAIYWEQVGNSTPTIHICSPVPGATLNQHQHELVADWVLDFIIENGVDLADISNAIQSGSVKSPWWWNPRLNLEDNPQRRLEFLSEYCPGELDFTELHQAFEEANDADGLERLLITLSDSYAEENPRLTNSAYCLKDWYEGSPSVLHDRWEVSINDPNNPSSVRYHIPIGHIMVPQIELRNGTNRFNFSIHIIAGNTLLVNEQESRWFARFACQNDEGEWYDFHPEAIQMMRDALFEQWFTTEDPFVRVKNAFIDQDGEGFRGKFHRYHLLHIVACLTSQTED